MARPKKEKIHTESYSEITFDQEGWANNETFKPIPFDLVFLKILRDEKELTLPAWWTGRHWYGRKINDDENVIQWRRYEE